MATITWQTASGSLGSYPAGSSITFQLFAQSDNPSSIITYKLLSGNLPAGILTNPVQISLPGYITGTFDTVYKEESYTFTIRAFDQFGNVRDRTFSMSVTVANIPKLNTTTSKLLSTYDSTWVDLPIGYQNPITSNVVTFSCSSGELPPGLYVTPEGRIKGYANPPVNISGTPVVRNYYFTIQLQSALGNDSYQYSIEVINQRLVKPPHSRMPAICNSKPVAPVANLDPYLSYYIGTDNVIPIVKANEYFTFKVLGYDFDGDELRYSFGSLPTGLVGDPVTGWITGEPIMGSAGISDFVITVSISKLSRPLITSPVETFYLRVVNEIVDDIQWVTNEDLGIIYNNTVSEISLKATSSSTLLYSFVSGNLPANLSITNEGAISGRVAYQPANTLMSSGTENEFVFTVQAYAEQYPTLRKTKTFRLRVQQYYNEPVENVYFKASPTIAGRIALKSLLEDTNLIPTNYLYRPDDLYFGKSKYISAVQAYGIPSSSLQTYLSAIQTNHYTRNIALGALKTAIARDDNGNVIYEVVYSELVDDLVNSDNVSIPQEITWPRSINLNLGPWTVNNSDIHASYSSNNEYYTSMSPGSVKKLNPGSLDNMRSVLVSTLGQDVDYNLLPKWMTSQQENGNTLGFIRCWVLCYTLPGYSSIVKSNIENNWAYNLTDIDFTVDRYYVDKSTTYNWDINLLIPAWTEVPSEVPNPDNPEQHDITVLFPRKTILPK